MVFDGLFHKAKSSAHRDANTFSVELAHILETLAEFYYRKGITLQTRNKQVECANPPVHVTIEAKCGFDAKQSEFLFPFPAPPSLVTSHKISR